MTAPAFAAPTTQLVAPAGTSPLATELQAIIRGAADNAPRSLQRNIGPSEAGHPCSRRIAYRLLDMPKVNTSGDPLASIIGTATHAWLADAFTRANVGLPITRWLVEQRVSPSPTLHGSADLFDAWNGDVIDWKVVGATSLNKYKKDGPSPQYRAQAHLYGLGFANLGFTVNKVTLAFLPRGGFLSGMHLWSESYRPDLAHAALNRLADILDLTAQLDPETNPERWEMIPAAPDHGCTWCPMLRHATGPANAAGCSGHLNVEASTRGRRR